MAATLSDDELYSRYLAGEAAACDELMLRYGDSLTVYLNALLRDWQEAEDIMIEVFARIMAKRPDIREGGFKAYLFKSGRHMAARIAAKRKRVGSFQLDLYEEETSQPDQAESRLLETERSKALYRCLDRIDQELREALWLVYGENLSYIQAAGVMGVSRKKVDNLLVRGKQLVRIELEKEGVTDAYI